MSETRRYADVVLPGSLMEEDEGTTTNVEGRVIHHRQVVKPPAGAREDWRIICDLAGRLGAGDKFPYQSTREIFDEIKWQKIGGGAFKHLSMGMSNDFATAIAEGATMVRIGSTLFGGKPDDAGEGE